MFPDWFDLSDMLFSSDEYFVSMRETIKQNSFVDMLRSYKRECYMFCDSPDMICFDFNLRRT